MPRNDPVATVELERSMRITELSQLPLTLKVDDVASVLGIGKANAYDLCHSKNFPSVIIGKRIVIPKPAFIEWLKNPHAHGKEKT